MIARPLVLAALLATPTALAQPGALPRLATLQETFNRGVEAERTGRHAEACALFEEVLRHHDEPLVRVNLAISYRAVGRYVDAIDQLRRYLAAPLPDERPEQLAQMRDAIAEMARSVVRVTVVVRPAGARLRVDRRPLEPGVLTLDPGHHVFELDADRHQALRRELDAEPGSAHALDLALAPVVTTGRVSITPVPARAAVSVDGVARGTGPVELTLEGGEHAVEVTAPSHTPLRRTVTVAAGGVVHVDATLTPSRARPAWLLPVVIAGSLLLAGGIATAVVLATRNDDPSIPGPAPRPF
jgi:hypothetical protein